MYFRYRLEAKVPVTYAAALARALKYRLDPLMASYIAAHPEDRQAKLAAVDNILDNDSEPDPISLHHLQHHDGPLVFGKKDGKDWIRPAVTEEELRAENARFPMPGQWDDVYAAHIAQGPEGTYVSTHRTPDPNKPLDFGHRHSIIVVRRQGHPQGRMRTLGDDITMDGLHAETADAVVHHLAVMPRESVRETVDRIGKGLDENPTPDERAQILASLLRHTRRDLIYPLDPEPMPKLPQPKRKQPSPTPRTRAQSRSR